MTTNHIDQLAEWWENAEEGVINEGDRLIYRDGNDYDFRTAGREDAGTGAEKEHEHGWGILARAPKPAWHDAPAIIAHTDENPRPSVWTRHKSMGRWDDEGGCHWADAEDLRDVTPLIEAKVTYEMVEKARNYMSVNTGQTHTHNAIRGTLAAALGLETE